MSIIATENCINLSSYGEICVQCNACGRFGGNQEDIAKAKLIMMMNLLKEYTYQLLDKDYDTLLQQKNIVLSIHSISEECVDLFNELGAIKEYTYQLLDKETPDGLINLYGIDIKFSKWIKEGGCQR